MSIPQQVQDELMAKCGRRCCICRRFAPLHLQIHHITEKAEGGDDDPDNLIVVCLTCHSDAHAGTVLSKRFTRGELKRHRDETFRLVAEGKLVPGEDGAMGYEAVIEAVLSAMLGEAASAEAETLELSPHAAELLLQVATGDGTILDVSSSFTFSSSAEDVRAQEKTKASLDELEAAELMAWRSGILYTVTYKGFLLADEILAAGAIKPPADSE